MLLRPLLPFESANCNPTVKRRFVIYINAWLKCATFACWLASAKQLLCYANLGSTPLSLSAQYFGSNLGIVRYIFRTPLLRVQMYCLHLCSKKNIKCQLLGECHIKRVRGRALTWFPLKKTQSQAHKHRGTEGQIIGLDLWPFHYTSVSQEGGCNQSENCHVDSFTGWITVFSVNSPTVLRSSQQFAPQPAFCSGLL